MVVMYNFFVDFWNFFVYGRDGRWIVSNKGGVVVFDYCVSVFVCS